MMDVPKDIPENIADEKKPGKNDKSVEDDVSIADLGEPSIMEEDNSAEAVGGRSR